jgi:hypothetical protein
VEKDIDATVSLAIGCSASSIDELLTGFQRTISLRRTPWPTSHLAQTFSSLATHLIPRPSLPFRPPLPSTPQTRTPGVKSGCLILQQERYQERRDPATNRDNLLIVLPSEAEVA